METREFTHSLGGATVQTACVPEYEFVLRHVFELLEDTLHDVYFLQDGFRLQLGWNMLLFRREADSFRIQIPDYTGRPFADVVDDITPALIVHYAQNNCIGMTGISHELLSTVTFQDTMLVHKKSLERGDVYLHHAYPTAGGDSGWYMGPLDIDLSVEPQQPVPEELTRIQTWKLLQQGKLDALSVLPFPQGYMAILRDNRLAEIIDNENNTVYPLEEV